MKTIKVFLAASLELKNDRNLFGNAIRRLDYKYEKYYGHRIKLYDFEDCDPSYNNRRKQDDYNDLIRDCDRLFAIFNEKAGRYTIEELMEGIENCKKTGFPKCTIYSRVLPKEDSIGEMKDFYNCLNDLKYNALVYNDDNIRYELEKAFGLNNSWEDTKVENGYVKSVVEGEILARIENLPYISDNEDHKRMKTRLLELDCSIEKARSRVEKYPDDEDFVSDLQKLLDERNQLDKDISRLEMSLLDTSKYISQVASVTERMRCAMGAFDVGKVEEAYLILKDAEKDADHNYKEYIQSGEIVGEKRENVIRSIDELGLKASIVMSVESIRLIADRISQVENIYKIATKYADEVNLDKEKYYNLLDSYGAFLYKYGRYVDSEEIYSRLIHFSERLFGEDDKLKMANTYNNIGRVYYKIGKYDKALDFYNKALGISREECPVVAMCYNNIGLVHYGRGEYDRALEFFNKCLVNLRKIGGNDNLYQALVCNNIGLVYCARADYEQSLRYFDKSLEIREKFLGKEHLDTANVYHNLGSLYMRRNSLGDYDKALEFLNKSLEIKEKILGERHPDVAKGYNEIGMVYYNHKEWNKALDYFNKALQIVKKISVEDTLDFSLYYNNIGLVYNEQRNYENALENYERALGIREKFLSKEHPDTAAVYHNIGDLYIRRNSQGDYDKALEFLNKSLEIKEKILGERHPDVAKGYNEIGLACFMHGHYDNARDYYNKALQIIKKVYGDDNLDASTYYSNIGLVCFVQGDYNNALEFFSKALRIMEKELGGCSETNDVKKMIEIVKAKMV